MNDYPNYVKDVQEGNISLKDAIFACNNLLVTTDIFSETTTEEIEYLGSQIERLNEICTEQWMRTQGYQLDNAGIYIKEEKNDNLDF